MPTELADSLRALPRRPGVYCFRDRRASALYVGRAGDLSRRVRSYFGALGDRPHLRAMVRRVRAVDVTECRTEHEAAFLERRLIVELDPPFNRSYGTEVEVYVRLRPDGALHVVHDTLERGSLHFGPYLGGRAVHDASIALRTLYPLDAAARAVAAARGIAPARPDEVRARLVAFLSGDVAELAAATARLMAMRDAATERLAFEWARDVQIRIAALSWLAEAPCAFPRHPSRSAR